MSNHLDSLAVLIAMSMNDRDETYEASKLTYHGKQCIDRFRSGIASNRERYSGREGGDSMVSDKVKVVGISLQNQTVRPFHLSKGQVCALVHGQALECGVGPGKWLGTRNRITYLTAKDALRWRKLSEWVQKSDRKNQAKKGIWCLRENESIFELLNSYRGVSPDVRVPHDTFVGHISDLPENSYIWLFSRFWWNAIALALPVIYGGVHLSAWNFQFASKTEQLLWKIACFSIMGTMPTTMLIGNIHEYLRTKADWVPDNVWRGLWWSLLLPPVTFHMLSRLYIVVEAFISLRHVPIGAYAATPWVQAIPHV